jgi:hypothetical protein
MLEIHEANANSRLAELNAPLRDKDFFKRNVVVPTEPIFIASTEKIGTSSARANHKDSMLYYAREQMALKEAKAPI